MADSRPVIPRDWAHIVRNKQTSTTKNQKRKGIPTISERNVSQKTDSSHMPPESMQDACNNILSAICRADGCTPNKVLDLDPILSNAAYKGLVENLFGSDSNCVAPTIPVITKVSQIDAILCPVI
jgi:hypothetical protein